MNSKDVFQQTIRRDLDTLEQNEPSFHITRLFLEKIVLPILSLFPNFFLGIHYCGKVIGLINRILSISGEEEGGVRAA